MGSEYFTLDEAATRLKCCRKTIQNYIKKGFLTPQRQGKSVLIPVKDVEQLATDMGSDTPALNRQSWFRLWARVEKLENEMMAVKHILDIRTDPLRATPEELRGLHMMASQYLSQKTWRIEEMQLWAKQFEKMDEVFLKGVSEATENHKAWQPFFRLCVEMQRQVLEDTKKTPSRDLETLFLQLDEGRKKLRGTILTWIDSGQGALPEAFLASLESPREGLARALGRG
jgi:excisionase family DNA binding protein